MASSMPFWAGPTYSRGTVPPTMAFSKIKPAPGSSGSALILT